MVFNRGKFSSSITRWTKGSQKRADIVFRTVAIEGMSILLRRSPVLHGSFRGNWRAAIGKQGAIGPLDLRADKADKSSSSYGAPASFDELLPLASLLANAKFGDKAHLTNNLPYAKKIERGTGSPGKAPRGVLRLSFLELKERLPIIISAAKSINLGS